MAALRSQLYGLVFAEEWSYGSSAAAHTALIGRCYERFAAHAVAVAKQVCHLIAGQVGEPGVPGEKFPDTWPRQEHQHPRPVAQRRCVPGPSGTR